MTTTRRMTSRLLTLTAATTGMLVGDACRFSHTTDHCANANGNDYCVEKYTDEADPRPYCARGTDECTPLYPAEDHDGCVAERPADDMCYSPCGGMKSLSDDPDCEITGSTGTANNSASATGGSTGTSVSTSTTSSMTGSTMSTTAVADSSSGPQGCAGDDACGEPGTPICIDQVCSPCESDAQCAAKDPANPACRDDGQCVQCTASNDDGCGGATPICDAAVNTCMGCAFHEQCPDSACRIATGECFDEAAVVHVDADDGDSLSGEFVDGTVIILHNFGSTTAYQVNLALDTGVAAILAAPGDAPRITGLGGAASISVENGGELYLANGVQVIGSTEAMFPGIAVDNASLYLDRARVVTNLGGGISLDNGAYALVRNSFVGGGATADVAALQVNDASSDIVYSTLVGYDDGSGGGAALRCSSPDAVIGRNSIFVKTFMQPEIVCSEASITYSVTESAFPGTGNVAVSNVNLNWFSNGASDFSLTPMAPAAILTAAQWQTGDPLVDIDGTEDRPGVDGSADVAGADIP